MSKQKKEPLSLMTVKTLLGILLFTGMGVIIIGGGYIIGEYYKNKITKPIVWETENPTKENFQIESMWKTKVSKDPEIASGFQQSVEINILDNDYNIIDDEYSEFQFIEIADFSKYMHDEKLVLPKKRVEIDIPLSAIVDSVSISGFDPIDLGTVNIPIYNSVPPRSLEPFYLNSSALSDYTDPTNNPIWFQRKNALVRTVYIDVIPVVFDIETKNAILYKNLTIKLDYETEQNGILIDASTFRHSYGIDKKISAYVMVQNTIAKKSSFKIYGKIGTVMGGELISIDNSFDINSGEAVKINIDFDDSINTPDKYFFEAEVYDSTGKIGETGNQFTVFSDQLDISKASVTDDWQTYRNEEFGFEFKHQGDLKSEEEKERINLKLLNCGTTITVFDRKFIYLYEFNDEIIKFAENPERYENYYHDDRNNSDESNQMRILTKKIKIDGNTALDFHILSKLEQGRNIVIFRDNHAFVIHGVIPYAFATEKEKEADLRYQMFNKFLSTFKFIE